jgi:hypothetical protein
LLISAESSRDPLIFLPTIENCYVSLYNISEVQRKNIGGVSCCVKPAL